MSTLINSIHINKNQPIKSLKCILNEYLQLKSIQNVKQSTMNIDQLQSTINELLHTLQQQKPQSNTGTHIHQSTTHDNGFIAPSNKRHRKSSPHKLTQRTLSNQSDSDQLLLPQSILSSPYKSLHNTNNSIQHTQNTRQVLLDAQGFANMLNSDYPELLAQLINRTAQQSIPKQHPTTATSSASSSHTNYTDVHDSEADISLSKLLDESMDAITDTIVSDPRSHKYLDSAFLVDESVDSIDDTDNTRPDQSSTIQRNTDK